MRPSIHRARRATATAAVLLLVVLGASGALIVRAEEQQREALASRVDTRRATAASFIEAYISEVFEREKALGARALAGSVTSEGFVKTAAEQGFAAAVLLDARGRLLASQPANPAAAGSDLGRRYPHLRAAVAGAPTVSGVVPSAARGLPVVGFAVPFQTPSGRRVFSGGYLVEDTPVAPFVRNASPFKTAKVVIVDAGGVIVASNLSADAGRPMSKWSGANVEDVFRLPHVYGGSDRPDLRNPAEDLANALDDMDQARAGRAEAAESEDLAEEVRDPVDEQLPEASENVEALTREAVGYEVDAGRLQEHATALDERGVSEYARTSERELAGVSSAAARQARMDSAPGFGKPSKVALTAPPKTTAAGRARKAPGQSKTCGQNLGR